MTPGGDVTAVSLIAAELRQLPLTARGTTQVMHEPGPTLAPASASPDGREKNQRATTTTPSPPPPPPRHTRDSVPARASRGFITGQLVN